MREIENEKPIVFVEGDEDRVDRSVSRGGLRVQAELLRAA
jgi:hypothetical protein